MAIAIPAMTGYINDSKKDSMVSTALHFVDAATNRLTADNNLPVSGQSKYVLVSTIELSKGGVSPYTNQKFSDASVIQVTNTNGVYEYKIYLVDSNNNCLTATEQQLNASTDAKRDLVKTQVCGGSITDNCCPVINAS